MYRVYISELLRFARACDRYSDFLAPHWRLMRRAEALIVPPYTKLALSALQGEHLQDVGDTESLISLGLLLWLEEKNMGRRQSMFVSCWSGIRRMMGVVCHS